MTRSTLSVISAWSITLFLNLFMFMYYFKQHPPSGKVSLCSVGFSVLIGIACGLSLTLTPSRPGQTQKGWRLTVFTLVKNFSFPLFCVASILYYLLKNEIAFYILVNAFLVTEAIGTTLLWFRSRKRMPLRAR